ncbi:MAG: heavy metal-associated domain-containing protein, partial [Armatimonadota bacterium]|nr:heavy-metal-associated domain-containing protein [Armatimonadota bacterium]MDW8144426.1 heavy metal-associated domain-containing protein [Armatimonadota bacterium]
MPKRYSLTVEGMHCAACAETVAKALKSVKGVKSAEVNFATERALVELDDSADLRKLVAAVENAGYKLSTQTVKLALDKPLRAEDSQALQAVVGVLAIEPVPSPQSPIPAISVRYLDGVIGRHELLERLKSLGYQVQTIDEKSEKPTHDEAKAA